MPRKGAATRARNPPKGSPDQGTTGATKNNEASTSGPQPLSVLSSQEIADDFSDLMDLDFTPFIDEDKADVASLGSDSSLSSGLMSKTPFKTPVPSSILGDLQTAEAPQGKASTIDVKKLREQFVGLPSSLAPSFKIDDSQRTRILDSGPNKAKPQIDQRNLTAIYRILSSDDDEDKATSEPEIFKLPDSILPDYDPEVPVQGEQLAVEQAVNKGQEQNTTKLMKGGAKRKAPPKAPAKTAAKAPTKASVKAKSTGKQSGAVNPKGESASPPDRLANMLSFMSEPESLHWEEPLVGVKQLRGKCIDVATSPTQSGSSTITTPPTSAIPSVHGEETTFQNKIATRSSQKVAALVSSPAEAQLSPPPSNMTTQLPMRGKEQVSPIIRFGPEGPLDGVLSPMKKITPKTRAKPAPRKVTPKPSISPTKRKQNKRQAMAPSKRRRGGPTESKQPLEKITEMTEPEERQGKVEEKISPAAETKAIRVPIAKGQRRASSRARVSETGSPSIVELSSGPSTDDEMSTDEEGQDGVGGGSPNRKAGTTKPSTVQSPAKLLRALPTQNVISLANIAGRAEPEPRQPLKATHPRAPKIDGATSTRQIATGKMMQENAGVKGTKRRQHRSGIEKKPANTKPMPGNQYSDPSLVAKVSEAYRQRLFTELDSFGNRRPSRASTVEPSKGNVEKDTEERTTPEPEQRHLLGGVLHTIVERTLDYVKAKEEVLEDVTKEYHSNATVFIDKVSNLHDKENKALVSLAEEQYVSFARMCAEGEQACGGFRARLGGVSRGAEGREKKAGEIVELGRELGRELEKQIADLGDN